MFLHSLFMERTLLSLFMFVHGKLYKLWQPSHNKYMSIFIRTVSIKKLGHVTAAYSFSDSEIQLPFNYSFNDSSLCSFNF